jgi:hypothetical protein
MASDEKVRPYMEWYVAAVAAAGQAIRDGEDAAEIIREAVSELGEDQARNVLQVMIARQAQRAVEQSKRKRS